MIGTGQHTAALEAHSVSVRLGGVQILHDLSISIDRGERRAIVGPNGAGKTTMFNVLGGGLRPDSGRVSLNGRDVTRWNVSRRASAGLARTFQVTNLMHTMSVVDNVVLALAASRPRVRRDVIRPLRSRSLDGSAAELLERWGLGDRGKAPVEALSYGERRELELVLAVAGSPDVLMLDEPAAGLSPAETARVCELIERLPRNTSIVLIEHDLDMALALSDTVTVMAEGTIRGTGRADDPGVSALVKEVYLGTEPVQEETHA
ncbi:MULTISPECIES: ABC transporter ATP-binding protein [unclassified Nocardioides]|uniref:ABC transporter ATP-binding protein n=1 Tax=Nocardioides sp. URHA0032 TaxID=1380388 RepID=UPI00056398DA|nr:ATP-binding cassette domain-containing protein [Nocardioides sp. URHA0032]